MATSDKNNVTKRSDVNRGMTYQEGDANFDELKNVIDDAHANEQNLSDHENAGDPHPQYMTESETDSKVADHEAKTDMKVDQLDQRIDALVFDSVQAMKDASFVEVGQKVRTLGYYSPGDGGGCDYEIVAAGTGTDDGGSFINLSGSGLQAKGALTNRIDVRTFGMVGDGVFDNGDAFQKVLDYLPENGTVYIPSGVFYISALHNTGYARCSLTIEGDGMYSSVIKKDDYRDDSGGRRDIISFSANNGVTTATVKDISFEGQLQEVGYRISGIRNYEGLVVSSNRSQNTITFESSASDTTGFYDGQGIIIESDDFSAEGRIVSYDGPTRTATVSSSSWRLSDWTALYVQTASSSTGFGIRGYGLESMSIINTELRYIRNQAASFSNCNRVNITNNKLFKCMRGGISLRQCQNVVVSNNNLKYVGDDCIFNSFETLGSEPIGNVEQKTVISNNVIEDCQGILVINARDCNISDNVLIRPVTRTISFEHARAATDFRTNSGRVIISNNLIVDPLDRNRMAYNVSSTNTPSIKIASSYDTVNYYKDLVSPETYWNLVEGDALFTPINTRAFVIQGNQIVRQAEYGTPVSELNGEGFFYRKTFNTPIMGFQVNAEITEDTLVDIGMEITNLSDSLITGNLIDGISTAILFEENPEDVNDSPAFAGIVVQGNILRRAKAYGIRFTRDSFSNGDQYINGAIIRDNTFNLDPLFESPGRNADGTFSSTLTPACLRSDPVRGLTFIGNTIENCVRTFVNVSSDSTIIGNILFSGFVETGSSNPLNKGVRYVPKAGDGFKVVYRDSDPTSPEYMTHSRSPESATQISGELTFATWPKGTFVKSVDTSVYTDSGGDYVILGWFRMNDGNTNSEGTDWKTIKGYFE